MHLGIGLASDEAGCKLAKAADEHAEARFALLTVAVAAWCFSIYWLSGNQIERGGIVMRIATSGLFAAWLLVGLGQGAIADESICAVPLREALMTVKASGTAANANEASIAWQCSFKFSTHDEALKAGLTVGTVVYGVPLQVGGSFDKKKVDQWKDESCSKNAQSASFEGASYNYLREVAPGAMEAFVACVQANVTTSALDCSLTRDPSALMVKWRRTAGEAASAAPKVRRLMVTNGTCQPGLLAGTAVSDGGVGTPCTPVDKKDLMVMVETSRGLCTKVAPYPKKVFAIVGNMALDSDRQITSDVVEFKSDSRIVTNGHSLTISATEISVVGGAEIDAFDKNASVRPPGTPGQSGGAVLIKAVNLTGNGDLRIDLTGQDGVTGAAGANGSPGPAGDGARGRGLQGIRGCGGGNEASPGGPGTPGKDGAPGGNGGNGGVVVQVAGGNKDGALSRLIVVGKDGRTAPGKGGALAALQGQAVRWSGRAGRRRP